MSRLTYKLNEQEQEEHKTKYLKFEYFPIPDYCIEKGNSGRITSDMIYNKLGKLEDLEEEIGCPLEKLSKKEYIYANDYENVLREYKIIGVNFKEKEIWFWDSFAPMHLEFKDYKQYFWFKEDRSE